MLIRFSVSNYLSFAQEVTLDMTVTTLKEHRETHVCKVNENLNLLKASVIYGANASGKSNVLKALNFFRNTVISSVDNMDLKVEKFAFDTKYATIPSYFEIEFLIDKTSYRFGCELNNNEVIKEWLFRTKEGKKTEDKTALYTRDKSIIKCSKDFSEGKDLSNKTRENALFLTVCAKFNGKISEKIFDWFKYNVAYVGPEDFSMNQYEWLISISDDNARELVSKFLKIADTQIEGTRYENSDEIVISSKSKDYFKYPDKIFTQHKKYENGNLINTVMAELSFDKESEGTKKLFGIAFHIIAALKKGKLLLIDELDSKIHPIIIKELIKNFMSLDKVQTQLIFTTHDTLLLSNDTLRRDEVWFAEKDKYGATSLFSLADFKKVRNDSSFAKDYILGKYGAIPFLGDFTSLTNNNIEDIK